MPPETDPFFSSSVRPSSSAPPERVATRWFRGVGPARAEILARAGLRTAWDLLHELPRPAPPAPPLVEAGPLPRSLAVRLRARLLSARGLFRGRGMGVEALLERADGLSLKARFFNAAWIKRRLLPNEWYLWEGRVDEKSDILLHPSFIHLPGGAEQPVPAEEPGMRMVYRAPEGFTPAAIAKLVEQALREHLPRLVDPLGELPDVAYQDLVRTAHQPPDEAAWRTAVRALARRELSALAWRLQERRAREQAVPGRAWRWSDEVDRRARARLPFTLTPGQEEALTAIRADMRAPAPMCRLLQGDVGSGKTALAAIACLCVIAEGAQAWLLAPTAILAEQHHAFLARCLQGSRVRLGLLTGALKAAERAAVIAGLCSQQGEGGIDLLIGTHALLEEDVRARELGLVVVDEQHRFGVGQRAALAAKASAWQSWRPDLLLLSATPIPRTLALTVYGDLAVSRIAGAPPGRGQVSTELVPLSSLSKLDAELDAALAMGGRAFVVCPRKEDDAGGRAFAAAAVHRHVAKRLGDVVRLMHGDLGEAEKSSAMADFVAGRARVLVTTTVVEVGIDVPEATLLAVLDADRFGLAQLHQLRGRIGRGALAGRCVLYYRPGERGEEVPERLRVLAASADGLAIAEADLAARGPGELLGTSQHGALALRIADLGRDLDLLQEAHEAVRAAIARGERMPEGLGRFAPEGREGLLEGG